MSNDFYPPDNAAEVAVDHSQRFYGTVLNVADITNPTTGKTFRQENLEKTHQINVGSLVEINYDDSRQQGVRLFVGEHNRDCDGTPLYSLTSDMDSVTQLRELQANKDSMSPQEYAFMKMMYRAKFDNGHSEEGLTVIREVSIHGKD